MTEILPKTTEYNLYSFGAKMVVPVNRLYRCPTRAILYTIIQEWGEIKTAQKWLDPRKASWPTRIIKLPSTGMYFSNRVDFDAKDIQIPPASHLTSTVRGRYLNLNGSRGLLSTGQTFMNMSGRDKITLLSVQQPLLNWERLNKGQEMSSLSFRRRSMIPVVSDFLPVSNRFTKTCHRLIQQDTLRAVARKNSPQSFSRSLI
jgi:hypothetical protein